MKKLDCEVSVWSGVSETPISVEFQKLGFVWLQTSVSFKLKWNPSLKNSVPKLGLRSKDLNQGEREESRIPLCRSSQERMLDINVWLFCLEKKYSSSIYEFNHWWDECSIFMLIFGKDSWNVWLLPCTPYYHNIFLSMPPSEYRLSLVEPHKISCLL